MRSWYKLFLLKNSNITINPKLDKSFDEHEKTMEGYEGYKENEFYKNKELFIKKYFNRRLKFYDLFLRNNLSAKDKVLSVGSGRGISEFLLLREGYNITCSDIQIPECYISSKKLFGNYDYRKIDILQDNLNEKFDSVIALSMIYTFNKNQLNDFCKKIYYCIKDDGILIIDPGGSEDNFFSFIYDKIYLSIESYLLFFIYKLLGRPNILVKKHQGYKFSNKELINIIKKNGFNLVNLTESDYLQEIERSKFFSYIMAKFPNTKKIFEKIGKFFPYLRMLKFRKYR